MKGSPGQIVSDAWVEVNKNRQDVFWTSLFMRPRRVPVDRRTPEQKAEEARRWDALQAEWAAQAARERDAFKGEIVEVREDGGPHVLVYADGRRVRVYLEAPEWT